MSYYPVLLNLKDKKCLVVGGGGVAARKVKLLLKHKADIIVVAEEADNSIKKLAKQNKIKLLERKFKNTDLKNIFLVVCATDDRAANEKISSLAKVKNVLVNVVDAPALCNFIVPASLKRGNLYISISTGGMVPGLSKKIRQELEMVFGDKYGKIVNELAGLRKYIIGNIKSDKEKEKIWKEIFNFPLIKRPEKFLKRLKNIKKQFGER